jgi:hypothetical protein
MEWVLRKTWCLQAGNMYWWRNYYYYHHHHYHHVMIITIFIQGISNYTSETNHAPKVYTVPLLSDCSNRHALTSWLQLNCPSLLCFLFRCLSSCSLRFIVMRCKLGLWARSRTAVGFVLCSEDSITAVVTVWQSCVCIWQWDGAGRRTSGCVLSGHLPTRHSLSYWLKEILKCLRAFLCVKFVVRHIYELSEEKK